jgi:spectinomycin phosphotransferase
MTAEQWKQVGIIFQQIHQVPLPPSGFTALRKDSFEPAEYSRWVSDFETQHAHSQGHGSPAVRAMLSSWRAHQPAIHAVLAWLNKLARVLQKRRRTIPYVICHGDLHPANLLRDPAGHVFVIDWDDVLLAPKERDFIFVGNAPSTGSTGAGISPFFAGYGDTEIDWVALAYYRHERVAQDVIAYAQQVFFRPDLSERTKADAVGLFHDVLAEGGELDVASKTADTLPPDLDAGKHS